MQMGVKGGLNHKKWQQIFQNENKELLFTKKWCWVHEY